MKTNRIYPPEAPLNFTLRMGVQNQILYEYVVQMSRKWDLSLGATIRRIIFEHKDQEMGDFCSRVRKILTTDKELRALSADFIRREVDRCLREIKAQEVNAPDAHAPNVISSESKNIQLS